MFVVTENIMNRPVQCSDTLSRIRNFRMKMRACRLILYVFQTYAMAKNVYGRITNRQNSL